MIIEFGEYMPDLPPLNNPGCNTIINAIPKPGGYQPFPGFVPTTGPLDSRCLGAYAVRSYDAATHTLAGDANKLYRIDQLAWADISRPGGYSGSELWSGVQWKDSFFMSNFNDPIQEFPMAGLPAQFNDLVGTDTPPPNARYLAVVRDFLFAANVADADGVNPMRVRWSGFNAPHWWTPGVNQSDFQDLPSNGFIRGLVGTDYGVVFQERAITRFDNVGSQTIFDVNVAERERGTNVPASIIPFGNNLIGYLGRDGFYVFDGSRSHQIGDGKVDKTFYRGLDQANILRMSGAVDTINQILMWTYPGPGSINGSPNRVLLYNYSEAPSKTRWSSAEVDIDRVTQFLSESYTLEGLDAVSPTLEGLPFSLDSRFWQGGNLLTIGFDAQGQAGGFTGTPYTAVLETKEFEANPGRRAHISKLRPVIDVAPEQLYAQIGVRNRAQDRITWKRQAPVTETGDANVRANGRYFRARVGLSGSFDHALGIEPDGIARAGNR